MVNILMFKPIVGYFVFLMASALLCKNVRDITQRRNWKPILFELTFQILVAIAFTNVPVCTSVIEWMAKGVMKISDATAEGTKFCFGYIGGGDLPFNIKEGSSGFIFAFQALPSIILVSVLAAVLM